MATIIADTEICASSGMCALTAPDHFDQDDQDGRVVLLRAEDDDSEEVADAVRLCPSGALRLER
ncbi:ferredoxin [Microlunatus soli]|uniref:Ferredoxin n=1 Tax=Microlunatus soli TaxID=630515 RepID=A0A1H1MT98_9ACTN|nr:(4Fe-4S)-binding protein [Microlunatus soli]SDR89832.1 ferredoxin [Microlunatus soli]